MSHLKREQKLAAASFSSSLDLTGALLLYVDLPAEVRGKVVLDVGAGASTIVSELEKLGATGIALDYRYFDFKAVKSSVDKYLAESSTLPLQIVKEAENKGLPLGPQIQALLIEEAKRRQRNTEYVRYSRKTRNRFFDLAAKGQVQLVAGIAGALPFKTESIDIYLSIQAVTKLLVDREVFFAVVFEALRVLKPGGRLLLAPWVDPSMPWLDIEIHNALEFLKFLKTVGMDYRVRPRKTSIGEASLQIIKS